MSRSKRRPKPRMPGDGCFFCDPKQREDANRRIEERRVERETRSEVNYASTEAIEQILDRLRYDELVSNILKGLSSR